MRTPARLCIERIFVGILFTISFVLPGRVGIALAAAGDVVADRVLGQPDGFHNASNTVDPEAMNQPNQIAVDKSVTPNRVYVADTNNDRVLGYHSVLAIFNGAPADLVIGQSDFFSSGSNGTSASSLSGPKAVTVDKLGNLYVADSNNNRVLEYNKPFSSGKVTAIPANEVFGQALSFTSNQCNFGFSAPPTAETMCGPSALALDANGNLFVADTGNNRVLAFKIPFNAATDADVVFGQNASFITNLANLGSTPTAKTLSGPTGLAIDPTNNLYVADSNNNRVLKYNSPLTNTTANLVFGQAGLFVLNSCNNGGSANAGTLCAPGAVALDAGGSVFIADTNNNRILMYKAPIAASPAANLVFGQGNNFSSTQCNGGFGPPSNATLCGPKGVALDSTGGMWLADTANNRGLKYSAPLTGSSLASVVFGQPDFTHNSANTVDGSALNAPNGVAIDRSVIPNRLYVVDTGNNRVLGYKTAATFISYASADLVIGQADLYSGSCNQGGATTAKSLCAPLAAAVDALGNLFVADANNNRVMEYSAPFLSAITANQSAIAVFGQGGNFSTNTSVCPPAAATIGGMCQPAGVAIDTRAGNGSLYVSDEKNNRILRFKPPFATSPSPNLVLGQVTFAANACNRDTAPFFIFPAANSLCGPTQLATDAAGNLYAADTGNNRVLEYNAPAANGAAASRVFGQLGNFTGEDCNFDGDDASLDADSLCTAQGVTADVNVSPNIYIADTSNNRVLEYNIPLTSGTSADMIFGQPSFYTSSCNFGASAPSLKSLCAPLMAAVDKLSNLYVADTGNNRVLEYDNPLDSAAGACNAEAHCDTDAKAYTDTDAKAYTDTDAEAYTNRHRRRSVPRPRHQSGPPRLQRPTLKRK